MSPTLKKICFYSFKGGAGRTVCTANIAGTLSQRLGATQEHPTLLLDLDLDSAGLTILLGQQKQFEESKWSTNKLLQDELALDVDPIREEFFNKHMIDVSPQLGAAPGTVRFIGGEIKGAAGMSVPEGKSLDLMLDFIDRSVENGNTGIIIDSASGWQQTAMLSHFVADIVVYCCRLTHQFIEGTKLQLQRFVELCETSGRVPSIILLPVAVPPHHPDWDQRRDTSLGSLQSLCNRFKQKTQIELATSCVDEVLSFKWYESVLAAKPELTADDEIKAKAAFDNIAEQIIIILHGNS
jgi:cellulose biosynthesis protein BcsQ